MLIGAAVLECRFMGLESDPLPQCLPVGELKKPASPPNPGISGWFEIPTAALIRRLQ
jgi:hypothetical protein